MAKPTLQSFAQALYDSLTPMQFAEVEHDYALAKYVASVGTGFQINEDLGRDQGTIPGWASVMSAELCPSYALGWLAQFVGVRIDSNLSDADQRDRIKHAGGWSRGTVAAMRGAIDPYLTGTKNFAFRERFDYNNPNVDSPYNIEVVTQTAQTPNPTAAQAALIAAKPAGLVLHYVTMAGQDYLSLKTTSATYQIAKDKYADYNAMKLAYIS